MRGNRPNEQVKSDRQANDRGVEDADVGESVFVGIAPVRDWRHEAPGLEAEHDRGGNGEHDAQPGRRGHFGGVAHIPPRKQQRRRYRTMIGQATPATLFIRPT